MRVYILLFTFFFTTAAFAQQVCCSATDQFAALADAPGFAEIHPEPMFISDQELEGEWLTFPTPDGKESRAYAVSAGGTGDVYLFVFHEFWGLNLHVRSEADRLARELKGVNVIALDLYDGKITTTREAATELMKNADEDRIRNIIRGAIAYAGEEADLATIGWCFGGTWSMQAAMMMRDQAEACVVYYGMPEQTAAKLESLDAPVLGIFAEKDGWINREEVAKYERAMDAAGKEYQSEWYDAEHAFANPSSSRYHDQAAEQANKKALQFLHQHLVK